MHRKDYQQVKEIFEEVLALPQDERTVYLDKRFSNRPEIRREIEKLLDSYDSEFLEKPAIGVVANRILGPSIKPGQMIGQYKLRKLLGEGGMGVVYEAEQRHPKRLVAVKLIRDGIHAAEYNVKLFEREIQALARLRHSGIAPIYESGLSEDGQTYFAMELVRGMKLMDFVRSRTNAGSESSDDTTERLLMFRKICDAVSYAHQRGVIHRDLKPDNILTTNDSELPSLGGTKTSKVTIKILDFGLARIMEPNVVGKTELSQAGEIKGTLQYMSPEQVRGNPLEVDLRTDIYSLGVLLYEILFEELPYNINRVSVGEAIRIICERQPARPGELSANAESGRCPRKVDRDLETIAFKALEKEPEHRYQSVAALAEDIDRYLTNEPILARSPSVTYQFRKLVARHRAAFASLALVFFMLLGLGITMASQSARLAFERDRAIQAEVLAGGQTDIAEQARQDEQAQRIIAEDNFFRAEQQRAMAEREKLSAETAREAEKKQRHIAETNFLRAEDEQKRAEEQKTLAEQRADHNARLLYVSQINLAQQAWDEANIPEMEVLLTNQIPNPGETDLRGFEWYYLWRLCHRDEMTFKGLETIYAAAFSPDGSLLAIGGANKDSQKITKLIDAETGQEVDSIAERVALGFAPDGRIITAGKWRELRSPIEFWDRNTRQTSPTGIIVNTTLDPVLSNDGGLLASQELYPKEQNINNLHTGNKVFSHKSSNLATFQMMAFSADNKLMASAAFGRVTVLDTTNGTERGVIETKGFAFAAAFSPDNRLLAIGNANLNDSNVTFWDVATKQIVASIDTGGGQETSGSIKYLRFSPDGQLFATTIGRTVEFWNVGTGKKVLTIAGHGERIMSILFSPNGKRLATWSADGTLKLWTLPNLDDPIEVGRQFGGSVILDLEEQTAISPDHRLLVTINRNRELNLWDGTTYAHVPVWSEMKSDQNRYFSVPKFSSGGRILAVQVAKSWHPSPTVELSRVKSLQIWDVAKQMRLGTIENVVNFEFSSHAEVVALMTGDGTVEVRELPSLTVIRSIRSLRERKGNIPISPGVAISPDGTRLVLIGGNKLELVDLRTGNHHEMNIMNLGGAAAFSPDGRTLAFSVERKINLLDFANRVHLATLGGRSGDIVSLAFSPDGKRLASVASSIIGIDDGKIRIWDLSTKQALLTFYSRGSMSAVFDSDGSTLLSSGSRGTEIRIGTPILKSMPLR